jgi:3-isopropylmalate/(R)-2-methylmalate dehydratase small subunit
MENHYPFTGTVALLDRADVDTDQIIPRKFLKLLGRSRFGEFLFHEHRYLDNGELNPDFPLNHPRYSGASILVARENFGCGSSREHAVWALSDYGFRAIIAPSFGDIFKNNCLNNRVLPVELEPQIVDELFQRAGSTDRYTVEVDLENQRINGSDGFTTVFQVNPFYKGRLLAGLDGIAATLEKSEAIGAYETIHQAPWQAFAPCRREEIEGSR